MNSSSSILLIAHSLGTEQKDAEFRHFLQKALSPLLSPYHIDIAYLSGAFNLDQAHQDKKSPYLLYVPLLLTDGYITKKVIPQKLAELFNNHHFNHQKDSLLPPLMQSPQFTPFLLNELHNFLVGHNLESTSINLMMVGHGHPDQRPQITLESCWKELTRQIPVSSNSQLFFLKQAPYFTQNSILHLSEPTLILPMFVTEGSHFSQDIPQNTPLNHLLWVLPNIASYPNFPHFLAQHILSYLH